MTEEKQGIDVAVVAAALKRAGADTRCPRCANDKFNLMQGFFAHTMQNDLRGYVIGGGDMLCTAVLVCTRCGFVAQHDLSILNMIPADEARH